MRVLRGVSMIRCGRIYIFVWIANKFELVYWPYWPYLASVYVYFTFDFIIIIFLVKCTISLPIPDQLIWPFERAGHKKLPRKYDYLRFCTPTNQAKNIAQCIYHFDHKILYQFYNFQLIDIFGLCKSIFGVLLSQVTHIHRTKWKKEITWWISIRWRKQQIKECHWNWATTKFVTDLYIRKMRRYPNV